MNHTIKNLIFSGLAGIISLSTLAGCTHLPRMYKLDIEQGNKLTLESVQKIKIGMTQEEVQQWLGTPALHSTFRKDTWYYVYYHKPAYSALVKRHAIIHFKEGLVSSISQNYT